MSSRIATLMVILGLIVAGQATAQDKGPQEPATVEHHRGVKQRGDQVMGFSHEKTQHHFRLYADGGAIEVEAKDANDTASRDQIRAHLSHIARMFADGNFHAPMLIHSQTPPGVPTLERLKRQVAYEFQETERGGRVRITTRNAIALRAVHDFLRFQITDHQTGDSVQVAD